MGLLLLLFAIGIFGFLIRNIAGKTPKIESEEELKRQGYTAKEAKIEARKQRQEHRAQIRSIDDASRTATRAAKLAKKLLK